MKWIVVSVALALSACSLSRSGLVPTSGHDDNPIPIKSSVATLDMQDLPPLVLARHGTTAAFRLAALAGTDLRLIIEPPIDGQVTLDSASGWLRYTPSAEDLSDFVVTVQDDSEGVEPVASVAFSPRASLPPESRLIEIDRPVPSLPIYNDRRVTTSTVPQWFNGIKRTTRAITVSGFEVRFDPEDPRAELNELDGVADIEQLTIEADSVVIRGRLSLPQTDVIIRARELIFDDSLGPASIDTSALPWPLPAGDENPRNVPASGNTGFSAGDVHLIVAELSANAGPRFIMNGSRGQDPEPGRDGTDGSISEHYTHRINNKNYTNVVYVQKHSVFRSAFDGSPQKLKADSNYSGSNFVPSDGKNGVPAGRPGDGGPGGNLFTTDSAWRSYVQSNGGAPGAALGPYDGGRAGQPSPWRKVRQKTVTFQGQNGRAPIKTTSFIEQRSGSTRAGNPSPEPLTGEVGPVGEVVLLDVAEHPWLSSRLLELVVDRLRDVYQAGRTELAFNIVRDFGPLIDEVSRDTEAAQPRWRALHRKFTTMSHRLAAGLDYFGHPPGWVPNLSVEVNYRAFEQEIDSALRLVYLSYWLERYWHTLDAKSDALDQIITLQQDDIQRNRQRYANSRELLRVLASEQDRIDRQAEGILISLQQREESLADQAIGNVRRRAILRTLKLLGEIVVSHKKPTAYAIFASASSDDLETAIDPGLPLSAGNTVLDAYRRVTSDEDILEVRRQLAELDPAEAVDTEAFTEQLLTLGDQLGDALQDTRDALIGGVTGDEDVLLELQRLKAQDPSFETLVNELVQFMGRQQVFAAKVADIVQILETTTDDINAGWLSVDSLNRARDSLTPRPPLAAVQAIRSIRERSKDRLIRYQYFLAKAYEYRVLKPYPGDYRNNRLFDKLSKDFGERSVDIGDPETAPALELDGNMFAGLKAIYIDELRTVVGAMITGLNTDRPEPVRVTRMLRLGSQEIDQLNTDGTLTLDLSRRGLVTDSDINVRIVDVAVVPSQSRIVWGDNSVSANLELTVEPPMESHLRWDDIEYVFDHRRRGVAPVRWGYTWDSVMSTGRQIQRSGDAQSLLTRLLDNGDVTSFSSTQIRFMPGARGELQLRREIAPIGAKGDVRIDILTLSIELQLFKSYRTRTLDVQAEHGALVQIDTIDLSGRKFGYGAFRRFYLPGQTVSLSAPEQVGQHQFAGWYDAQGLLVDEGADTTVTLDDHEQRRARYTAVRLAR